MMCGIPSIVRYLLPVDPVEDENGRSFLQKITDIFQHATPYVYPAGLAAQTASVYLTVVVTLERYVNC